MVDRLVFQTAVVWAATLVVQMAGQWADRRVARWVSQLAAKLEKKTVAVLVVRSDDVILSARLSGKT